MVYSTIVIIGIAIIGLVGLVYTISFLNGYYNRIKIALGIFTVIGFLLSVGGTIVALLEAL